MFDSVCYYRFCLPAIALSNLEPPARNDALNGALYTEIHQQYRPDGFLALRAPGPDDPCHSAVDAVTIPDFHPQEVFRCVQRPAAKVHDALDFSANPKNRTMVIVGSITCSLGLIRTWDQVSCTTTAPSKYLVEPSQTLIVCLRMPACPSNLNCAYCPFRRLSPTVQYANHMAGLAWLDHATRRETSFLRICQQICRAMALLLAMGVVVWA